MYNNLLHDNDIREAAGSRDPFWHASPRVWYAEVGALGEQGQLTRTQSAGGDEVVDDAICRFFVQLLQESHLYAPEIIVRDVLRFSGKVVQGEDGWKMAHNSDTQ